MIPRRIKISAVAATIIWYAWNTRKLKRTLQVCMHDLLWIHSLVYQKSECAYLSTKWSYAVANSRWKLDQFKRSKCIEYKMYLRVLFTFSLYFTKLAKKDFIQKITSKASNLLAVSFSHLFLKRTVRSIWKYWCGSRADFRWIQFSQRGDWKRFDKKLLASLALIYSPVKKM